MSARVAELVDALASGASVRKDVEVQVLSRAPNRNKFGNCRPPGRFFLWRRAIHRLSTKKRTLRLFERIELRLYIGKLGRYQLLGIL